MARLFKITKKFVVLSAIFACIAGALGAAIFFYISRPQPLDKSVLSAEHLLARKVDLKNGEALYNAGGCISCHRPAKGVKQQDLPSGGAALHTPIGTFYPPNITPDKTTGIGNWTPIQFINAMKRGLSPQGKHYFPAFPYTSYAKMKTHDLLDLQAYILTLQAVDTSKNKRTDIFAGPVFRRGVGAWKRLGLSDKTFAPDPNKSASWNRGAYLVSGAGHCNECHTPRNLIMISDFSRHLAGGPHPEGKGKVPSLRGLIARKKFSDINDLNSALRFGEIMGYEDMSSGGMGDVQTNMSKLPEADTKAISEYILSLK